MSNTGGISHNQEAENLGWAKESGLPGNLAPIE